VENFRERKKHCLMSNRHLLNSYTHLRVRGVLIQVIASTFASLPCESAAIAIAPNSDGMPTHLFDFVRCHPGKELQSFLLSGQLSSLATLNDPQTVLT
jgi:hypothetical protein